MSVDVIGNAAKTDHDAEDRRTTVLLVVALAMSGLFWVAVVAYFVL